MIFILTWIGKILIILVLGVPLTILALGAKVYDNYTK